MRSGQTKADGTAGVARNVEVIASATDRARVFLHGVKFFVTAFGIEVVQNDFPHATAHVGHSKPVAAALAVGTPVTALGPEVADLQRLSLPEPVRAGRTIRGVVIYVDHFGNLASNVDQAMLRTLGDGGLSITIGERRLRDVAPSYASVAPGEAVAVVNSWGLLEIAVRDGSAARALGVQLGEYEASVAYNDKAPLAWVRQRIMAAP